ncbi:MAG TPA: IS110 family transposase [Gaiellaceae bacterium]|jgi:transposase|nr:IS110 family transposase [Gaiellaceae bacterium]
MEQLYERCCALDVHKATVSACVRVPDRSGARRELKARFSTMTSDLLALRDWLVGLGVTRVAMEATGVYWKPVWYVLEDEFELVLCNAAHVKNVPGRKTDASDAQWLCQLLEHGLLRGSFVPPKPIRELRDLTRYRKTVIKERQREANRLHKVLEDAGIKLGCVAADILGVSGRAMIEALVAGHGDPEALAELARGRLRAKLPALRLALEGRFSRHHGRLVSHILAHIDYLDETIASLSDEIGELVAPFEAQLELLETITGVGRRGAECMLAELGPDMTRFPTHRHCARWARISPGNNESGGKRRHGTTGVGNPWLREILIECARAASRSRDTYLKAQYLRLRRRRGDSKAIVAVAHSILVSAYYILARNEPYTDLGFDHYERLEHHDHQVRRLTRQLEALGHRVTLEPLAA